MHKISTGAFGYVEYFYIFVHPENKSMDPDRFFNTGLQKLSNEKESFIHTSFYLPAYN